MTDTATASTGLTEAEAAEFRQKCVDFMEQFAPGQNPTLDDQKAFLAAAAEAGLGRASPCPKEYGGGGLTLAHEKIWREVKGNYPMPDSEFIISHGMCLPMLDRVRHPRAEGALPRRQHLRQDDVVPDVLRAGRRLRRRQPADQGRARRRRVGASTARRCGPRSPTSATTAWSSPAPIPTSSSTPASRCSSSTCARPASRSARSTRSTAARTSTRCSSPTCASRRTG